MYPPSKAATRQNVRLMALCIGAVLMALVPFADAAAHGPHARVREVFSGPAGPYAVKVQAIPLAGSFHMTVQLTQQSDETPVSGATVRVSGTGPLQESEERARFAEELDFTGANAYSSVLPVEVEGDWQFEIEMSGALGEAVVNVSVDVQGPPGVDWSVMGVGIVLMALVFIFASKSVTEKIRGRRRSRPRRA